MNLTTCWLVSSFSQLVNKVRRKIRTMDSTKHVHRCRSAPSFLPMRSMIYSSVVPTLATASALCQLWEEINRKIKSSLELIYEQTLKPAWHSGSNARGWISVFCFLSLTPSVMLLCYHVAKLLTCCFPMSCFMSENLGIQYILQHRLILICYITYIPWTSR